jgi:zinc and cadmium transporter
MPLFLWTLTFSLIGSLFSLTGGLLLLFQDQWVRRNTLNIVSWAAGMLVSIAFLDLFPEAVELAVEAGLPVETVFGWALAAILLFFFLERSFIWFHHHHEPDMKVPSATLLMIGDTLHNFIDGVVIAAAFLISVPTGIVTALAVAAHEIPQEIADFGLLLRAGIQRKRVLVINFLSALATPLGALIGLFASVWVASVEPHLLGFAAGMFTYISCSDLIPELHHAESDAVARRQLLFFAIGVLSAYLIVRLSHGV